MILHHPLEQFVHCPKCGSARFIVNDQKSKRCGDCGFEYYLNPSSANAAFVVNAQGELLVVRRAKDPCRGMLDLPGGFADIGEMAEEGVIREVMEETGLHAIKATYLFSYPNSYEYSGFHIPTLDLFFLCEVDDLSTLRAHDDAAEVMWLALGDVTPSDFAFSSIQRGVKRYLEQTAAK